MKWYDAYGFRLDAGDIVMDTDKRQIGRVVYKLGKPCLDLWKEFSPDTLNYHNVVRSAVNEAYIKLLATRSDLYYKLHHGRLDQVEIIRKRHDFSEPPRIIPFDAPVPGEWMYEQ